MNRTAKHVIMTWEEVENTDSSYLKRSFQFKDFSEAWAFMNRVALEAEKAGHHPDWSNSYNKVVIKLSTHDAGNKITAKDRKLAAAIDSIYGSKQ